MRTSARPTRFCSEFCQSALGNPQSAFRIPQCHFCAGGSNLICLSTSLCVGSSALPVGYLIYIFCYGGKSVTVLNDGLVIELWLSRLLHLNRVQRIRWEEIQEAEYRAIPGARGSTVKLSLSGVRGRVVFWSVCFDDRELRRLREILREKLGNERVKLKGSGSGL